MIPSLRRAAPSLTRFLERKASARDEAAFVAGGSLLLTWIAVGSAPVRPAAWALVALTTAEIALFVVAIATLVRYVTRKSLNGSAYALGVALVASYLVLDHLAYGILQAHPSLSTARETFEALRAGAIHAGAQGVAAGAASIVVAWILLTVLLKALTLAPATPRVDGLVGRLSVPLLLVVAAGASVRTCVFAASEPASAVARAIPWDQGGSSAVEAPPATGADRDIVGLLGDDRLFRLFEARRAAVLAGPIRSRARPDVLIVHVESLRYDMLREHVAPSLVALGRESIVPRHHLATGTNTGTGVFGIVSGLLSPYYPFARRTHARPLPLEVLKALGYELSVYFANNFRVYDGLYDLFFAGLADHTYDGPGEPVFVADAKMVDAYIASLRAANTGRPRFDYVVLDSTHYDYSYPPAFEKFAPAMTLGLGVRDGFFFEEGLNERLKPRGPFIRNRYQNSVLYADSLVGKIVAALRDSGRLERTIVIVVGDHGEEFWEHGAFGHGYGHLSLEQREVPLVLRVPESLRGPTVPTATRYRYSSHADLFPTVFDLMGLDAPGGGFMNGKSLLRYEPSLDFAVVGFGVTGDKVDHRMLVVGDGLAVHWYDAPPFAITDTAADDDLPLPHPEPARAEELVFRALGARDLR